MFIYESKSSENCNNSLMYKSKCYFIYSLLTKINLFARLWQETKIVNIFSICKVKLNTSTFWTSCWVDLFTNGSGSNKYIFFTCCFSLAFCCADMLKGSFYANPILDIPTTEAPLIQRYKWLWTFLFIVLLNIAH